MTSSLNAASSGYLLAPVYGLLLSRSDKPTPFDKFAAAFMSIFQEALSTAFALILQRDAGLIEIIGLSMQVSLTALFIAPACWACPLRLDGSRDFLFKQSLRGIFNALMGIPPVVVGLIVYLNLSRSGLFGALELLYPTAMIIAQVIISADYRCAIQPDF